MSGADSLVIHWFRQDLRVTDNPSLCQASKKGRVMPLYILDDQNSDEHFLGGASRWWLHRSLTELDNQLDGNLSLYRGDPLEILIGLVERKPIERVFWNRCYEPWRIERDKIIKKTLGELGVTVETFNGSLLWEPWNVLKQDGTPYKVFSPFYRNGCLKAESPREPLAKVKPQALSIDEGSLGVDGLGLLPSVKWYQEMEKFWNPGERGAASLLDCFVEKGIAGYKEGRNFPASENVSRLSPHIHFGEISPNQVWYSSSMSDAAEESQDDLAHFHSELGWREFSYNLLFHFESLPTTNLQSKFDKFPWIFNEQYLEAWKAGMTGYPIVDAGMRELWQTGYMHNRVRMIVGSFLVKNLLIHWHHGERWFWDCLVDADLASNSASWQWVSGSGADAAPYFRIFNPVTQGQKFDADGAYTRHFVPELRDLPSKFLHNPWEAPKKTLEESNVALGKDYPEPIVDLRDSRLLALEAFSTIRLPK